MALEKAILVSSTMSKGRIHSVKDIFGYLEPPLDVAIPQIPHTHMDSPMNAFRKAGLPCGSGIDYCQIHV